ncbi:MAG: hypothetical protein FAZ92_03242 [Accumulibacter sp.]|nr:MAG: hypothetical protein FAZ92_03242 [Accumulibacter sp.]
MGSSPSTRRARGRGRSARAAAAAAAAGCPAASSQPGQCVGLVTAASLLPSMRCRATCGESRSSGRRARRRRSSMHRWRAPQCVPPRHAMLRPLRRAPPSPGGDRCLGRPSSATCAPRLEQPAASTRRCRRWSAGWSAGSASPRRRMPCCRQSRARPGAAPRCPTRTTDWRRQAASDAGCAQGSGVLCSCCLSPEVVNWSLHVATM